jgi:hypothetical protein
LFATQSRGISGFGRQPESKFNPIGDPQSFNPVPLFSNANQPQAKG